MKNLLITILILIFSLSALANEKFLINGNTLIYDTFKASDETLAEINWEDSDVYYKFLQKTLI